MSNEGPKRIQTEPTMPSVQAHKLVPPEVREAYLNAEIAQSAASFVMQDEVETLIRCPGPCSECPCCKGAGMVTHGRAKFWREHNESLDSEDAGQTE